VAAPEAVTRPSALPLLLQADLAVHDRYVGSGLYSISVLPLHQMELRLTKVVLEIARLAIAERD
jgi:hypothetical protein